MGYRAYGYGVMSLRGVSIKEVVDALDGVDYDVKAEELGGGKFALWYNTDWSYNYHEDDVLDILYSIKDLVVEGSRWEFVGEDDDHWAFTLTGGGWKYESATIVYGISPEIDIHFNGGRLIADQEMTKFLMEVIDYAGDKYDYDADWVEGDKKDLYKEKAQMCARLWLTMYGQKYGQNKIGR